MLSLTLAVMAALCCVFSTTRPYAFICVLLLIYLKPYLTLTALIAIAGVLLYHHYRLRRSTHGL